MGGDVAAEVTALVSSSLGPLGVVCVEASVSTAGTRRVLRVLVDHDISGLEDDATSRIAPLSLDEVAEAAQVVGTSLDDSGLMGERAYTLEVSSPGVGRPLTGYAALRRNVGRIVSVSDEDGAEITGRLRSVTPAELVVHVPAGRKSPAQTHTLPVDRVRSARVQVEFNRSDDRAAEEG